MHTRPIRVPFFALTVLLGGSWAHADTLNEQHRIIVRCELAPQPCVNANAVKGGYSSYSMKLEVDVFATRQWTLGGTFTSLGAIYDGGTTSAVGGAIRAGRWISLSKKLGLWPQIEAGLLKEDNIILPSTAPANYSEHASLRVPLVVDLLPGLALGSSLSFSLHRNDSAQVTSVGDSVAVDYEPYYRANLSTQLFLAGYF